MRVSRAMETSSSKCLGRSFRASARLANSLNKRKDLIKMEIKFTIAMSVQRSKRFALR